MSGCASAYFATDCRQVVDVVVATWPSGKAGVCKTPIAGSNPAVASPKISNQYNQISSASPSGRRFFVFLIIFSSTTYKEIEPFLLLYRFSYIELNIIYGKHEQML
jgi:hypothetical protein